MIDSEQISLTAVLLNSDITTKQAAIRMMEPAMKQILIENNCNVSTVWKAERTGNQCMYSEKTEKS